MTILWCEIYCRIILLRPMCWSVTRTSSARPRGIYHITISYYKLDSDIINIVSPRTVLVYRVPASGSVHGTVGGFRAKYYCFYIGGTYPTRLC